MTHVFINRSQDKYKGLINWFSPVSLSCEERDDQVQAAQQRAGQDMEAGWRRQGRSVKYFSFFVSVVRQDLVESVAFGKTDLPVKEHQNCTLFYVGKSFNSLWNFVFFLTYLFFVGDPDPNFSHPGSRVKKIPGSASKNLSILTQKIRKYDSQSVHPRAEFGSRILIFTHPGSRFRKSKRHRIRIRNTAYITCLFSVRKIICILF